MAHQLEQTSQGRGMHKRSLIAVACTIALACIVAATYFARTQTAAAVDLTPANCSITVNMPEGKESNNLVFDVYQVAIADADGGYDAYKFKPVPALENESGIDWANLGAQGTDVTASYKALAQIACTKTPLNGESQLALAADPQTVGSSAEGLSAGLYLVITHDKDLSPELYTTKTADGAYATIGLSPTQEFTFTPELIAVPYKVDAHGTPTTAGNGDWNYAANATLKFDVQPRYGSLNIEKNLLSYAAGHPAEFVFQIDAYSDEARTQKVYSNVVRMAFTEAGQQKSLVEGVIPAGSYVTVTEVYSGLSYEPTTEGGNVVVLDGTIVADPIGGVDPDSNTIATAAFTNDYNGNGNEGGSIVNNFTYNTPENQSQRGRTDLQWIWSKE